MSTMFDSTVYDRRRAAPWFCHASILKWMQMNAGQARDGAECILRVYYRHSVASRYWFELEFTDENGARKTVSASDTDLLTWRAEVAGDWKADAPYQERPKRRRYVFKLFGWRIVIER